VRGITSNPTNLREGHHPGRAYDAEIRSLMAEVNRAMTCSSNWCSTISRPPADILAPVHRRAAGVDGWGVGGGSAGAGPRYAKGRFAQAGWLFGKASRRTCS